MAPPNPSLLLLEARAAVDFASVIGPLARASVRRKVPERDWIENEINRRTYKPIE